MFAITGNIRKIKQAKEMAQKVEAKGGKGGNEWDDGTFDGVRKVYVGKGQDCIAFVKFEYVNGSQVVVGEDRGKKTTLGTEEVLIFMLRFVQEGLLLIFFRIIEIIVWNFPV